MELFRSLLDEQESEERESVMTIYSHLYTYSSDKEKNNEILKNQIYNNFFHNLEKKGWCFFENENYIIIAEFNSDFCESHFAILKK